MSDNPHGLRYIPAENAQITKIHTEHTDRIAEFLRDTCIPLQDETAALYKRQIDRLYKALVAVMGPSPRQEDIQNALALLRELRS